MVVQNSADFPIFGGHARQRFGNNYVILHTRSTSLDLSSIEFEIETDRNLYLDMRDTHLSLKL